MAVALVATMGVTCVLSGSHPLLGLFGSMVMWVRALAAAQAVKRDGAEKGATAGDAECNRAIDEAKWTFPLVLASFL